jgi:hypothetical protein
MSLQESDISQIETVVSEQLKTALDSFLKESVAPMVSGATKRALSEAPQVTEAQLKEQLEAFRASIADPGDLVNHAVSQVLERLSTVDDDQCLFSQLRHRVASTSAPLKNLIEFRCHWASHFHYDVS